MKRFQTKTIIFSALVFAVPAAAADLSGSWTIAGDVVGNAVNMSCAFTQDGAKVTGACDGVTTTGSVTADKVTFQHTQQGYELTYSGTLDATGSSMKGEIAVAGVTGTFSATKATPAPAAKADLAGNWTFSGEVAGNAISMKCAFKSDGDKFTGTCKYQDLGDCPTEASVAGTKVTFRNSVQRAQLYDLTYNGTLDAAGTAMKGDIAVAAVSGTFSGTKDK